jgi:hypothetical protein
VENGNITLLGRGDIELHFLRDRESCETISSGARARYRVDLRIRFSKSVGDAVETAYLRAYTY